MIFEPILSMKYVYLFTIFFIISIIISHLYKIKNLYLKILTFLVFFILISNPKVEKKDAEYYKDIVLVVSDITQSIIETKKTEEVLSIQKDISNQLSKIENIEQINIKLSNKNEIENNNETELQTYLFKEVNNVINDLDIKRLSAIIVITDGQIHDLNNYNKLLSKIPIHYILVGVENEKDRILKIKNVPKYAVV